MNILSTRQFWNITRPYLIIGKIILLVLASLTFLYLEHLIKSFSHPLAIMDEPDFQKASRSS
jgi:hypothetical protein